MRVLGSFAEHSHERVGDLSNDLSFLDRGHAVSRDPDIDVWHGGALRMLDWHRTVDPLMHEELFRYRRQMVLAGFGETGQRRLLASHAIVVGMGALGCVSADLLVRAGVGRVTLIDRDLVEASNLQRQTLYSEEDARDGLPKAEAAAARLRRVNSEIEIEPIVADVTPANAEHLLTRGTVILDGTDNFEARYLINDVCVEHRLTLAYAGVVGTRFMQSTFTPGAGCLRCLFEEPPDVGHGQTCDVVGVLGPAVSFAAAAQAADVIGLLAGIGTLVPGRLLEGGLWPLRTRVLDVSRAMGRSDCPCCGLGRRDFLCGPRSQDAATLCGQDVVQISPTRPGSLDLTALAARLASEGDVRAGRFFVRVTSRHRTPEVGTLEITIFADGRALVRGTSRPDVARAMYARLVGS